LLEEQSQRLHDIASSSTSPTPQLRMPSFSGSPRSLSATPAALSPRTSRTGGEYSFREDQAQFLIPLEHCTSANSLLSLPVVAALAGRYPHDYFYDKEEGLSLPAQLDAMSLENTPVSWPVLDIDSIRTLVQSYFSYIHPNYPVISHRTFDVMQENMLDNGPTDSLGTAICYAVYALGCLASHGRKSGVLDAVRQLEPSDELALHLFQPALRVILRRTIWGFRPNLEVCQALVLAGSFFAYLGRPLHSWKMIYYASHKFIFLLEK
jgi:hypothetical protein